MFEFLVLFMIYSIGMSVEIIGCKIAGSKNRTSKRVEALRLLLWPIPGISNIIYLMLVIITGKSFDNE